MTQDDFANLTDLEIVQRFKEAATERGQSGFNWRLGNRILDNKLAPAYEALAMRGQESLKALLSLTEDPDPFVRKDAALLAYGVDPSRCCDVLQKLIDEPGWVGMMALVGLLHRDPQFSSDFEREANERFEKRIVQRRSHSAREPT